MVPFKFEFCMNKVRSLVSVPSSDGTIPVSSVLLRYKLVRFLKLPRKVGIGPVIFVRSIDRPTRFVRDANVVGTEPSNLGLSPVPKLVKLVNIPSSEGNTPVILLAVKSSRSRLVSNPNSDGTEEFRKLLPRFRTFNVGTSA